MFAYGHVVSRQSFLFLLDLEIKRARRYQNYLSLLSFTFNHPNSLPQKNPTISLSTLANLLTDELRESDVVGEGGINRLLVMLPYADRLGSQKVREKLEQILRDYGLATNDKSIEISEVCFPTHATSIDELLRMAGNSLVRPRQSH